MGEHAAALPGQAAPTNSSRPLNLYPLIKHVLDVVLALVALIVLSPLLLALALLIRFTSRGPVLFRQTRIGQYGRPFQLLKFRSMHAGADDRLHREMNLSELRGDRSPPGTDGRVFLLQHDPRITRVGCWLRRTSLDELPQLINVLKGEMSLVGPRPCLPWEVALFTPEQSERHLCVPGITGLWQVSNRYSLSMPEMLMLDVQYARTRSLTQDVVIILRTPGAVLFHRRAA
jgi:lipopolysaccharide/colanic/teichoic acid biosynthesis glycosyltransferase